LIEHGKQPKFADRKTCDWEMHWVQFPSEVHVAHAYGQMLAFVNTIKKTNTNPIIIYVGLHLKPNDLYFVFLVWGIL
jgi:hypothetical protein